MSLGIFIDFLVLLGLIIFLDISINLRISRLELSFEKKLNNAEEQILKRMINIATYLNKEISDRKSSHGSLLHDIRKVENDSKSRIGDVRANLMRDINFDTETLNVLESLAVKKMKKGK